MPAPPASQAPLPAPTAAAGAAPRAQRLERVGVDQPIPFPPRRSPVGARPPSRREPAKPDQAAAALAEEPEPRTRSRFAPAVTPPAPPLEDVELAAERPAPARFEEPPAPARIEPSFAADDEPAPPAPEAEAEEAGPATVAAELPPVPGEEPEYALPPDLRADEAEFVAEPEAPPMAAGEEAYVEAESPAPGTAARVSDLEKEMARLLGEISGRRS